MQPEEKNFLTGVVITLHEETYLEEWIDYHTKMGFDHFVFYDNNSTDFTARVLEPYIKKGLVELRPWPNLTPHIRFAHGCQIAAYQDALKKARNRTTWLAIFDTDEFIVPQEPYQKVSTVLKKVFNDKGPIYVNCRMFGTSKKLLDPNDSILHHLTLCAEKSHPSNLYGKTIFKVDDVVEVLDPHHVLSMIPYVNGSGEIRDCATHCSGGYHDKYLTINHYVHRDLNFFYKIKIPRIVARGRTCEEVIEDCEKLDLDFCATEDQRIISLFNNN